MFKFKDIFLGQSATITHVISSKDIEDFAKLSGDYNPIHLSAQYAKDTSYKKPIAHGMLSASFISQMIGYKLPGPGSLWISQSLEFHLPAFEGDTLNINAKVVQISNATRIIKLEIVISNQAEEILVTGKSTVKMIETKDKQIESDSKKLRTVLITGGSGGIGLAIARMLAIRGHNVIINYNKNSDKADKKAQELSAQGANVLAIKGDISNYHDVENIANQVKTRMFADVTDIVHCASSNLKSISFNGLTWEDFQSQIDVNIKGAFNCAKIFSPGMINIGGGAILMIGSIYAEHQTATSLAHYITSKAGMAGLCRSIAKEMGPMGIRANIVSPGMVDTELISQVPEKTKLLTKMNTPLRRIGEADDIANLIEYLIGPGGKHISGQTINVCGGITI